ncbi:enoyl-CoA hydratase/isomerase family protein [Streptomyces sp. V4-01]|uniref:3-hydroxyisobutyryl-CoA hydrolase n=1 Tax=Actinacidiphila polyblastidii TaxID=3110430 RepID=A0ABU7P956_9ACTN|nr:enoyl-CoA hydratase/isomerase family protein [Streptomyces sp. V4-01]
MDTTVPTAPTDPSAPPVLTRVDAGTGVIELNRPRALNALDLTMVRLITEALLRWRDDDAVGSVVVRSTSPKAFCAGGDIRAVRDAGVRGDEEAVRRYFSAEYALDLLIARYPKPYTALVDGYAMGGGLGVSVHGSAMAVTERALLAMPESAIGFFPDIGASYFLPRLPGAVGRWLALTGARISGAAALEAGLATHYVPAAELPALEALLLEGAPPAAALDRFATTPPPSELAGRRAAVDRCFGAPDLAGVRERLAAQEADREWAEETLAVLGGASPMSLRITWDLLLAGAGSSLEDCLARELDLAVRTAREPDFHEGVRALLIDKDRKPAWSAARSATM